MKSILLLAAALFFAGCSHGDKHHDHKDHAHHGDHKHDHSGPATPEGDDAKKHADGSDCGCGHAEKSNHSEGSKEHDHHGKINGKCEQCTIAQTSALAQEWTFTGITKEEFKTAYTKNKTELGKTCTPAAQEYCGKTTKDIGVTEGEATCLMAKTQRVTREVLPKLDKTPCAKLLTKIATKSKK